MRARLLTVAAIVVVLGACSGGADIDQDDDVAPVPDSVRSGLALLYAQDDATPEQAAEGECFAAALTDELTLDELVDAGLVGDDGEVVEVPPMLDVDVAEAWVDSAESCAPFVEVSTRALTAQSRGRLDGAAYAKCLGEAIEPDRVRAALVATLSGGFSDDPAVDELTVAQAGCARSALPPD